MAAGWSYRCQAFFSNVDCIVRRGLLQLQGLLGRAL
jgi:hypothetical protein